MKKTQMVKKGNKVINKEKNREIRKKRTTSEENSELREREKIEEMGR